MTTPTEAQFAEWRKLANRDFVEDLAQRVQTTHVESEAEWRSLVDELKPLLIERYEQMLIECRASPVLAWLHASQAFKDACSVLSRKLPHRLSFNKFKDFGVNLRYDANWRASILFNLDLQFAGTWSGQLTGAIDKYLHEDAELVTEAARNFEEKVQAVKALIDEIHKARDLLLEFVALPSGNWIYMDDSRLEEWRQFKSHVPLARRSERTAEKLFVYRVAAINRRYFGRAKPEAIAALMNLECIREPYDERQIERMCRNLNDYRAAIRRVYRERYAKS